MRISCGTTTVDLSLTVDDGWLTLHHHRRGPDWGSLGSKRLLPLKLRRDPVARLRRACGRIGHLWSCAPQPVSGENLEPEDTIHRKHRCVRCGLRADHPFRPS